jgi:hypothetical protein
MDGSVYIKELKSEFNFTSVRWPLMQDMNKAGPYLQVRPVKDVIGEGSEACLTSIGS